MELLSLTVGLATELAKLARALVADGVRLLSLLARSRSALAAENSFLRRQLTFYQERKIRPRRFDKACTYASRQNFGIGTLLCACQINNRLTRLGCSGSVVRYSGWLSARRLDAPFRLLQACALISALYFVPASTALCGPTD